MHRLMVRYDADPSDFFEPYELLDMSTAGKSPIIKLTATRRNSFLQGAVVLI
jgi:hypothetical protein